jgi:hypothetical protein
VPTAQRRQDLPTEKAASSVPTAGARGAAESQTSANRAKPVAAETKLGIRRLTNSRAALRQGIIMAEVLGKPVALRDEF